MATAIFRDTGPLESAKEKCPAKKVTSLSNKLFKKNSVKSGKDFETLCHLCYWLYIYGHRDLALACIKPTHQVEFTPDYGIWTFIHAMWGLEIRIRRELGEDVDRAKEIAATIEAHGLVPTKLLDTPEKQAAHQEKRRSRFTYESVTQLEVIDKLVEEGNLTSANNWRFSSLLGMIGNTETGLFPHLNSRRDDIEQKTMEYISILEKLA